MPYLAINDFKYGLDRRRARVAGTPGTLWDCQNAHLTRGGDIERAKKFVGAYELPTGTFGMAQLLGQLYTFGSGDLSASMPSGVLYQRLNVGSENMTRVLDTKLFNSKFYIIAEYDSGHIHHWYDGTEVTAWAALADANATINTLADYLSSKINASSSVSSVASGPVITVTARTPGTAFVLTINSATYMTATQLTANSVAVAETRATGTITITGGSASNNINYVSQITVNDVLLMVAAVNWVGSNSATAAAVAVEINNNAATHGYQAEAVGAVVTISAATGTGTTPNGYVVAGTLVGNVTATYANLSGGIAAAAAVAQVYTILLNSGAYAVTNTNTITVDSEAFTATGRASGMGTSAYISKSRVYSTANTLLRFCKLNDATDWTDINAATGAGYINLSNQSDGADRLSCVADYNGFAAIFSRRQIRLYTLSGDASQISFSQALDNTGIVAPRSLVAYGNNDVFYASDTGIRSLRPRDVLNAAYVSDIGTAIDTFVSEYARSLPADQVARGVGAIEPVDGRYWLATGKRVYVLSYFLTSEVTAWSYYVLGDVITDLLRVGTQIYARAGNTIYLYGGSDGQTYPSTNEQVVTVELPYLAADTPASIKNFTGYDQAATNVWSVLFRVDPRDDTKTINVGKVDGISFGGDGTDIRASGQGTHVAVSLTCSMGGAATISGLGIHFEYVNAPAQISKA